VLPLQQQPRQQHWKLSWRLSEPASQQQQPMKQHARLTLTAWWPQQ
jgi:hypothetical protein